MKINETATGIVPFGTKDLFLKCHWHVIENKFERNICFIEYFPRHQDQLRERELPGNLDTVKVPNLFGRTWERLS